ncbi:MAG: hypothetical protein GY787_03845 [Alteromonadales bacterium]|nr:hypothetical protein [Alteromonadales bacterium]
MEKEEFVKLIKKTKLQPLSIRAAYRALVLGEKNVTISKSYGISRQIIEQAKKRVLRQQEIDKNIPTTWVHISTHLPSELTEAIGWLEEQAKYQDGLIVKRAKKPPELSAETIELISSLLCSKNYNV